MRARAYGCPGRAQADFCTPHPLGQIQLAVRHQSMQITRSYLGSEIDLADAACDRLGIRLETPEP
jgi:hypothetical protein